MQLKLKLILNNLEKLLVDVKELSSSSELPSEAKLWQFLSDFEEIKNFKPDSTNHTNELFSLFYQVSFLINYSITWFIIIIYYYLFHYDMKFYNYNNHNNE